MKYKGIYLLIVFLLTLAFGAMAGVEDGFVRYSIGEDVRVARINVIGDVVYRQSSQCEVRVYGASAQSLSSDKMCVEAGGTLMVDWNGHPICADKVEILAPNIGIFFLYGVGTLDLGDIRGKELILRLYGNVEVKCGDVDADNLNIQHFGAGDVMMEKIKANVTDVMLSGASMMRFKQIEGTTINVMLPGVGSVDLGTVNANLLKVSVTGVGDVSVKGSVNVANISVTGSGEVNTDGLKARKMVNYNSIAHQYRQYPISIAYYLL